MLTTASNHSRREWGRRRARDERLSSVVEALELVGRLAWIILPLVAASLVARAAYTNYRAYVLDDDRRHTVSDRLWTDVGAATKSHRRRRRADKDAATTTTTMSADDLRRAVEHASVVDDVFVVVLHLGFTATCCVFDVALHWLLVVVRRHTAPPPFDFTGAGSVTAVTHGSVATVVMHGSVDARQCGCGDARQCGCTAKWPRW